MTAPTSLLPSEELLASRADPDQASERGQTPLMLAAGVSRHDLCEQLLTASAQPNSTDPDGKSALLLAAGGGCLPVCEALLRARADLLQRTTAGACALDAAAANGHEASCLEPESYKQLLNSDFDLGKERRHS